MQCNHTPSQQMYLKDAHFIICSRWICFVSQPSSVKHLPLKTKKSLKGYLINLNDIMSPYHVQIDSTYFHVMKCSLVKGKQISLLPLCLQKHKKYDPKKFIPPLQRDSSILSSLLFCLNQNEGGILIKIDIYIYIQQRFNLANAFSNNLEI